MIDPPPPLKKPTPAELQGHQYLESLVTRLKQQGQAQLPSLKTMAQAAGISPATLWKELQRWLQSGKILGGRGRVLRLPELLEKGSMPPPSRQALWEKLRIPVLERLNDPQQNRSGLTLSELVRALNCDTRTLRKTITQLMQDGVVERRGRSLWLRQKKNPRGSLSLAFIEFAGFTGHLQMQNIRMRRCLHEMERACAAARLQLQHLSFDPAHPNRLSQTLTANRPSLGCVFWAGEWMRLPEQRQRTLTLLRWLAQSQQSLLIIDETGSQPLADLLQGQKRVVGFSFPALDAGRRVAAHLLSHGHRRIAFFSPFHGLTWSQSRLSGLQSLFPPSSSGQEVKSYTASYLEDRFDVAFALSPLNESQFAHIEKKISGEQAEDAIKRFIELRTRSPFGTTTEAISSIQKQLKAVQKLEALPVSPSAFTAMKNGLYQDASTQGLKVLLEPFFQAAFEQTSITAWVGVNDLVALMARDFLLRKGRNIPRHISLVGFDDTPEAFLSHLDSFDFGEDQIASPILKTLLNRETFATMAGAFHELEGSVIPRGSVSKPRGR